MNRRKLLAGAAGAAGGALVLQSSSVFAAKGGGGGELAAIVTGIKSVIDPVTGAVTQQRLAGTLTITKFIVDGGVVKAVGTLVARITDLITGALIGTLTQAVQMVVNLAASNATCEVLTLVLGPLHLELLGLVLDLNQVVLTITGDPSGGLLGQLLCALAGTNILTTIAGLLNQLLGLLGSV